MKILPETRSVIFTIVFTTVILLSNSASGQQTPAKTDSVPYTANQPVYYTSRIVTAKPVIDGKLDDDCWKHGTWADDYHQFIPKEGAKPTYPTYMNIQYDDKNLYVAFRCFDLEPKKITRMVGVRDEQVGDQVGINFDSYRDYRTGFEFTTTAWGQRVDLILFNPMNWDYNWNPVWKVKTGLEDSTWVAEMEIPLSQLRYSRQDEQVWGLHTWRWISRLQEESNWEKQSKTGPGMIYNFGELRGIKGLKKSRRLEVMPFVLGDLKTMKAEPGSPFTGKGRIWGANAGLDAKIGVSSNFTIDLTVNPDFGQVESDPSVMNLTAFETFYEEKRPFFLEGLTIFDYKFDNQTLFYSRRIGHAPSLTVTPGYGQYVSNPDKTTILSAVKFSGTTSSGLSVGLIQSVTAGEYAKISDSNGKITKMQVEPLTNYTVVRIQKGYNAGNTIVGGMFTSTNRYNGGKNLDFLSSNAYTGGLDLLHHWKDKEFYIEARLLGSYIDGSTTSITALQESSARYYQRPGATYLNYDTTLTSLSGFGGKLKIGKGAKGLWRYSAGVTWFSPGIELNDLGYMNQADIINETNELSYSINQPVSIFSTYSITLDQINAWNFNGTFLGSGAELTFTSTFKNQWTFNANGIYHSGAVDTRVLRGGYDFTMPQYFSLMGGFRTDQSKNTILGFDYSYYHRGNNSSTSYQLMPGLTFRPFSRLKLGVTANYIWNRDDLQYVAEREFATQSFTTDRHYILGTINQKTLGLIFRVDLNITPEFSVQYYGSPFISRGSYSDFKYVTNPETKNYKDRFAIYPHTVYNSRSIDLDYNNDGTTDYSITDPDFNFQQFRSNLVARWEYRLGSFIYLVWSRDKTALTNAPGDSFSESYKQLVKVFPDNIFLIKLSYWFSL
jgi:hypothetical protein